MYRYTPKSKAEIAKNMSAIRSRDNKTELALRQSLHKLGLRYRLHSKSIIGKPDIVFPTERIAIFVDGDFWHARLLRESGMGSFPSLIRTPRKEYWHKKFTRRIQRDDEVTTSLRDQGWVVLRFWESDVSRDVDIAVRKIAAAVRKRRKKPLQSPR